MKTDSPKYYVFDTFAIFNFLSKEQGWERIENLILKHKKGEVVVYFNEVNLGELYYKAWKKKGEEAGKTALKEVLSLNLNLVSLDRNFILKAAEIKATNKVSYADSYCIQTAIDAKCPIITGDPEFTKIPRVKIIWIGKNN